MEKMAVTGGAGFIGSNLAEFLCAQGYEVTVVDDFSTGREENLAGWSERWRENFRLVRADVNDTDRMREAFREVRFVFHQAAIPSVPRSVADPVGTERANIGGTVSVLKAACDAGVRRVVFASSSSVYGDDPVLPKKEDRTGRPLSPYALSKMAGEEYCRLFQRVYGVETVCLRYFNVFGPRQDPGSEYAAVIPRFITRLLGGQPPIVYGDGEQTRDFTYVSNVVEANWTAAVHPRAAGEVFNVGCGTRISLNDLLREMTALIGAACAARYEPPRPGDVRHSLADIGKIQALLGYRPSVDLREGLLRVIAWHRERMGEKNDAS